MTQDTRHKTFSVTNPTLLKLKLTNAIAPFLHPFAVEPVVSWVIDHKIIFTVTDKRHSVHGDYRHPDYSKGHRISVNGDLNPHAFLLTTVHEMAHLTAWLKHRNKIRPHGDEWKNEFRELMTPFLRPDILPSDVQRALYDYLINPAASSCSDDNLSRVLARYDKKKTYTVEDVPQDGLFKIHNGRVFKKGHRIRKRYHCVEVKTKHVYLFSPIAEVTPENIEKLSF